MTIPATLIQSYSGFWGWVAPLLLFTYIAATAGLKEKKRLARLSERLSERRVSMVMDSISTPGHTEVARLSMELTANPRRIPQEGITSMAIRHASKIGILVLGLTLGYLAGQYQITTAAAASLASRYTYHDVLIVSRLSPNDYMVQPARMTSWKLDSCAPLDWEPGEKLIAVTYKQIGQNVCKDVGAAGAIEFYRKDGKRLKFNQEIASAR